MKTNTLAPETGSLRVVSADPINWALDKSHARLRFSVTHLLISEVEGSFKNFDATVISSTEDFTDATVTFSADVDSINTENEQRDAHLKNPDFFDVAQYPDLNFKSASFVKSGDKKYKVTGDLTMHGVTRKVELDAICNTGIHPMTKNVIAGFKVSGTIKRSDFNVGTSFLAHMLSDEVSIVANAEFIKQS